METRVVQLQTGKLKSDDRHFGIRYVTANNNYNLGQYSFKHFTAQPFAMLGEGVRARVPDSPRNFPSPSKVSQHMT